MVTIHTEGKEDSQIMSELERNGGKYIGGASPYEDVDIYNIQKKIKRMDRNYKFYDIGGDSGSMVYAVPDDLQLNGFKRMTKREAINELEEKKYNDGEDFEKMHTDKNRCGYNEEYVKPYRKKDGTYVKGFCRKLKR